MICNQQNINKLLEAGKLEDDDQHMASVLMPLKHLQSLNCGRPKQWTEIAQRLNIPDLIALNKGLTRAEFYHSWPGGSVAAVIWTFRVLEARCPEEVNHVADWILQRTKNSYLPYGFYNLGATSYAHYLLLNQQKDENYLQHLKRQSQDQELSVARKSKEKRERFLAASVRNTAVRVQFLKELSEKSLEEQLWQLANDPEYPVTFYPTCLAHLSLEKIGLLQIGLQKALCQKLSIKCRGPWAKFKKRLNATSI
jgi:hypothetical protein